MDVWECVSKLELVVFLKEQWSWIKEFGNSDFTVAFIGSLAGALGGAWAAQRIAERAKYKEQLMTEMKLTNAATSVAFGMVSSLLALKAQHILPIKTEYDKAKQEFTEAMASPHKQQKEIVFIADFRALTPPICSIDVLQSYVHGKLMMKSRPLALIGALAEALEGIKFTNNLRNELIHNFKNNNDEDYKSRQAEVYFGITQVDGKRDTRYNDLLNAVYNKTDDAIFFCMLLMKDLNEHCTKTKELYEDKFGKGEIEPDIATFEKPAKAGLLPDEAKYSDWITSFQSRPKKLSRLQRFKNWLITELFKKRSFKLG
ncbi:hypothetical protein [Methylotenera sp. L2L1]|uniref:hypothetical protein n=1 Tax=Methylotenera sp. L2L1 TaxID=1502770 RepID=UPI00055BFD48|nr:hypothetical protein [Methylotenera sp. L2L1]